MRLEDLDGYFSLPCSAWPCGWNDADRSKLESAISALIERERADAVKAELAKVVGFSTLDQTLTLHRTADTLREVIMSRQFDKVAWIEGVEIR